MMPFVIVCRFRSGSIFAEINQKSLEFAFDYDGYLKLKYRKPKVIR